MKKATYYLLDVFTREKYQGNQLAIFPDSRWIPQERMQSIAAELNLSETVFLYPPDESGCHAMRIFTPKMELPIAGHPIIGTGFFLAREEYHPEEGEIQLKLRTKIGIVPVRVVFEGNLPSHTIMRFPAPEFGEVASSAEAVANLLGLGLDELMDLPVQTVSCGVPFLIVPIKSLSAVRDIRFDLQAWNDLDEKFRSAFIYAFCPEGEEPGSHLHGRMFAPQAGILEDPATGSANAPLAAYCHRYDLLKGPLVSEQGFEMGRRSFLHLEAIVSEGQITGVSVGGHCVFIGKGELFLD